MDNNIKTGIIKLLINESEQRLYSLEVQARVAVKIGDTASREGLSQALILQEKRVDALKEELVALQEE